MGKYGLIFLHVEGIMERSPRSYPQRTRILPMCSDGKQTIIPIIFLPTTNKTLATRDAVDAARVQAIGGEHSK